MRSVPEPLRRGNRRVGDQRIVADHQVRHAVEDPVARLRRLRDLSPRARLEARPHRGRRAVPHAPALEDLERGRERGRVGRGRSRRDDIERVADDVGEYQRDHGRGPRGPREESALHAREVLTDRVQLRDRGSRRQEETRDLLLFLERDGWRGGGRERRATAGDEEEDEVVRAGARRQIEKAPRRGEAARVGNRVPGFGQPDSPERRRVAVLDDHEALGDAVAQDVLRRARHRPARLAAAEHNDARVAGVDGEVGPDERGHVAGGEGGLPDRARVLPRAHDASATTEADMPPSAQPEMGQLRPTP